MTSASTIPDAPHLPPPPSPPPPPAPPVKRSIPGASGAQVALMVATALVANLALQGRVASVAGMLAVVGSAAVVVWARPRRRWVVSAAALAVITSSNLVLRTSDWVVATSLVAIAGLLLVGALDRLGAPRWRTVFDDTIDLVVGAIDAVLHVVSPLREALSRAGEERVIVLRGAAVAAGVAGFLLLLLANADAIVGELLGQSFGSSMWTHLIVTALVLLAVGGLSVVAHRSANGERSDDEWAPHPRPVEAAMGLGAAATVLAAWVGIQATVAFGGAERLLATAGLTRAEYARDGFFELVTVVAVVLTITVCFGALLGADRRATTQMRALFGTVGLLTLALVGITFSRLWLYIDAFGLTMLRLAVAWFLGWLAIVVCAVSLRGIGVAIERPWIGPTVLVSAALVVTAYGWSNPEATVARTNLNRGSATVELDRDYLAQLGPDASPVLVAAGLDPAPCRVPTQPYGPLGWNLSRSRSC